MKDISQIKDQTFIENNANDEYNFQKKGKTNYKFKKDKKASKKKKF